MRIEEEDSNILQIPFIHFQNNREYQYRLEIKKELEDKKYYSLEKLTSSEENNLSFSSGYCRGFISGVHEVMKELKTKKLEVQLSTLTDLRKTLLADIERKIDYIEEELKRTKG